MNRSPSSSEKANFLDGIRALAALYVVVHHAAAEIFLSPERQGLSPELIGYWKYFSFERFAVDAFIVLSGFCLMLPALKPSLAGFFLRRFRRIYPPYLAPCS